MPTTLERLQYGFDRDSRRTWRCRTLTTGEDNAYSYDGLSQVVQDARGNLNLNQSAIGGTPMRQENWNYDPTGNWKGYRIESNGAVSLEQERVHDKGNRLTRIVEEAVPYLLDRVGRMTQMSPDASGDWEDGLQLKWDAWGRVTQIKRVSDEAVRGTYAYDGLTRRITREVASVVHHCYYSDTWRPLEERKDSGTDASIQYLWGARHRDDLVRRDRDVDGDGDLDEKRYVLMDYFSPASIIDEEGEVTERYAFSTFGIRRIMAPDFSPRSTSECGFEFSFQGQFLDTESGLYNYGYRYYCPHLGRWASKDPIGIEGGLSLYAFVTNNAVNRYDRLGLVSPIDASDSYEEVEQDGKSYTKIKKCNIVIFYGHNFLVPQEKILNEECSAATNISCGQDTTWKPGKPDTPIPNVKPYNDTPPDGPLCDWKVDPKFGREWAENAYEKGIAKAGEICDDKKKCCKKVRVVVECRETFSEKSLRVVGLGNDLPDVCGKDTTVDCKPE